MIEAAITRVRAGESLSMDEMAEAIGVVMDGQCGEAEIADLLTTLRAKGESVTEIAGAAAAMRKHMTPIRSHREGLIDTCGTGGDASGTFNISTAAALVTAAGGVPVAKHGNRSFTSKTGSADVLQALGVNVDAEIAIVEKCLDEVGFCFCYAPQLHPAMRHVAAVRKKLGVPTIFNLLGPLCNPASAPYQLLGVGRTEIRQLLAEALLMLGTQRALIVSGEDGLDEVTLNGTTHVIEASRQTTHQLAWTPEDFGLSPSPLDAIRVDGPEQSAAMVTAVLRGETGVARDIVVANAAAALWTADKADSLSQCAQLAVDAIDSGGAADILAQVVERSNA